MLIRTGVPLPFTIVDAKRRLPRFWATVWMLAVSASARAENTQKLHLRHVDAFYTFCDTRFGLDSLDEAFTTRDASKTQQLTEAFYFDLTSNETLTTTDVQRWSSVRVFVQYIARRLAVANRSWSAFSAQLKAMGNLRHPNQGKFSFIRALPTTTLLDFLEVAQPGSPRNPFKSESIQWRNWLIVNLLLLAGLLDPDAIVFGGHLPQALAQRLIAEIKIDNLTRRGHGRPAPRLVPAEAPDDTTAIGAALLPFKECLFM